MVHLSYSYVGTVIMSELDAAVGSEAFDWARFSLCAYLLWTSSDTETICRKVRRVKGMEDASVFASVISLTDTFFGYLPLAHWEWVRNKLGPNSLTPLVEVPPRPQTPKVLPPKIS